MGVLGGRFFQIIYGHLSRIVVKKRMVHAGEVIGYTGQTGFAPTEHLHFEVNEMFGEEWHSAPFTIREVVCEQDGWYEGEPASARYLPIPKFLEWDGCAVPRTGWRVKDDAGHLQAVCDVLIRHGPFS